MHAYGDIASIPRADNRTQSPYHAFGPRGRVFYDDAAVATSAAPSVAASPAAPAVSAGLPVFAASRSAAASESKSSASRKPFRRLFRSRGFGSLGCTSRSCCCLFHNGLGRVGWRCRGRQCDWQENAQGRSGIFRKGLGRAGWRCRGHR